MAGPNAGRRGGQWRKLAANLRMERRPCWLCGQPILYDVEPGHPDAFSVDHRIPLSVAPQLAEDPGNLAAAHARCNKSRGVRPPRPTIGTTSRDW